MLKIITTGRLGKDFAAALDKSSEDFEIKYVDELTSGDIEWADCLAAFPVSNNIDISGIGWIHSFGAGVEGFLQRDDFDSTTILTRTVGNLGFKMGEFCLCHILNFYQNTLNVYENKKQKKWESSYPESVEGKTVLILGSGEMAKGIASLLTKLRMKVIGVNTSGNKIHDIFSGCVKFDEVKSIANSVSCIINTLPLTDKTHGLLNEKFFTLFQNALFINVGRGQSVATGDLINAIDADNIAYAVLDVFETEPLPVSSSLWDHPDIYISPHQAAVTDVEDIVESFLEAYRFVKEKRMNYLFVDVEKSY